MGTGEVLLVGAIGSIFGGLAALISARSNARRNRDETRHDDAELEREVARIVNERITILFRGYDAVADERKAELDRCLLRITELVHERDGLIDRVRELGHELEAEKRRGRASRQKVAEVEAAIEELRKSRSHRRGTDG